MGEAADMETRTKYILQRVCVCERSTIGIRCIEREGQRERGKKKGKWEKKKGEIDIADSLQITIKAIFV